MLEYNNGDDFMVKAQFRSVKICFVNLYVTFKFEIVVVNLGNMNNMSEVVHSTVNQLYTDKN